jgi:serine/threonine protein kinase
MNDDSPTIEMAAPVKEQYELLHKLGEGGMGAVWLARDTLLHREVAIKKLNAAASHGAGAERFLREAKSAARLNHLNTVAVHHILRERDEISIVMEYVPGGSLDGELRANGAMSWRDATLAIRDAAAGLGAAHAAGLVHRDIKPANLMRGARGVVKVADFGLVQARQETSVTIAGSVLGTPAYMSPEQCQGRKADARSDLYSLGCTYFALLTRRPPFEAPTSQALLYRHCNESFPSVQEFAADVPDGVCRVISRLTQKDPALRCSSAQELLDELNAILTTPDVSHMFAGTGDSATVPATAPAGAAGKWWRSRRKLLAIALVLVASATIATIFFIRSQQPPAVFLRPSANAARPVVAAPQVSAATTPDRPSPPTEQSVGSRATTYTADWFSRPEPSGAPLSEEERKTGWTCLFDGKSLDGWRGTGNQDPARSWKVVDGILTGNGPRGVSLASKKSYRDFELTAEWRITPGGDAGVVFRGTTAWGPEYQLYGPTFGGDGQLANVKPSKRTLCSGACFLLYPNDEEVERPAGQWNEMRILAVGSHVEHWLNGKKVVEYEIGTADWAERVSKSSLARYNVGGSPQGAFWVHMTTGALQIRSMKIREINPALAPNETAPASGPANINALSAEERAAGWRLLFDGTTFDGWRGYKMTEPAPGWTVTGGALVTNPAGGSDMVTTAQFRDFELSLQWRMRTGADSGVVFRATEEKLHAWRSGPEIQIMDPAKNVPYNGGLSSGACCDLYGPIKNLERPIGQWNDLKIIAKGPQIEHWLNGQKIVEYEIGSIDWEQRLAATRIKRPGLGASPVGHVALLQQGGIVEYRSIKIREIK